MEIQEQNTQTLYISIHALQPKNKLERMLDDNFSQLDCCLIDMANVDELKLLHEKVLEKYYQQKGTRTARYILTKPTRSNWFIEIGSSITINLRRIKGTVINNN